MTNPCRGQESARLGNEGDCRRPLSHLRDKTAICLEEGPCPVYPSGMSWDDASGDADLPRRDAGCLLLEPFSVGYGKKMQLSFMARIVRRP